MNATDIPGAQSLYTQLQTMQAKLAKVPSATNIDDLFNLLNGTGLEGQVMQNAQSFVADFFNVGIAGLKAQLQALGVTGL